MQSYRHPFPTFFIKLNDLPAKFKLSPVQDILMAGIEGSGPIRLGSNSAQIPILLAKTKAQAFDKPPQEAAKNLAPGTSAAAQSAAVSASTAAPQNMQLQVIFQVQGQGQAALTFCLFASSLLGITCKVQWMLMLTMTASLAL